MIVVVSDSLCVFVVRLASCEVENCGWLPALLPRESCDLRGFAFGRLSLCLLDVFWHLSLVSVVAVGTAVGGFV